MPNAISAANIPRCNNCARRRLRAIPSFTTSDRMPSRDRNRNPAWRKSDRIQPPSKLHLPRARAVPDRHVQSARPRRQPGQWQRKSEKEMRRAGKPFRERVEKNQRQSNRREQRGQPIDGGCRQNKSGGTQDEPNEGGSF